MSQQQKLANAIRFLSMDAVQKANSGHPGMPMGMADIAEVLWNHFFKHNPKNPNWLNRDRFVLSNGHGSMLLYSLLHLTGYDLSIDDLKNFRQLHSPTPGHPEYSDTPGVETTTGPLGQGLANAVGMAIAETQLAHNFNKPNHNIIDHFTYAFVGDGCLMEGISHEVCSLAGTLGLGKLIVFYDDNQISIDGEVSGWFSDNTPKRFEAYDWHVIENINGHDPEAIANAIKEAQLETQKPTLICCKTTIAWGSEKFAGTAASHGAPLGEEEIANIRKNLNWSHGPFEIPDDVYSKWDATERGSKVEESWKKAWTAYENDYPELANELSRRYQGQLPKSWGDNIENFIRDINEEAASTATRKASLQCLNYIGNQLPELIGGSADLTGSNLTMWNTAKVYDNKNKDGNYIHFGVREFGMTAILNGIALHGGLIPFGGTFLVFSDYARNAVRLAALMKQRAIFVYTHDSIGLGEDGPTHQPIEHISSLRLIPNLRLWRPCDTVETAIAWQEAIESYGPSCLFLSRQTLPFQHRSNQTIENIKKGGYILFDSETSPEAILIATGSEVELAMQAAKAMQKEGTAIRVVSMPSVATYLLQDPAYQNTVLPTTVKARVAIEAGATAFWYKFVGRIGAVIGIDRFGASAPAKDIFEECSFTVDNIISTVKMLLSEKEITV